MQVGLEREENFQQPGYGFYPCRICTGSHSYHSDVKTWLNITYLDTQEGFKSYFLLIYFLPA